MDVQHRLLTNLIGAVDAVVWKIEALSRWFSPRFLLYRFSTPLIDWPLRAVFAVLRVVLPKNHRWLDETPVERAPTDWSQLEGFSVTSRGKAYRDL